MQCIETTHFQRLGGFRQGKPLGVKLVSTSWALGGKILCSEHPSCIAAISSPMCVCIGKNFLYVLIYLCARLHSYG